MIAEMMASTSFMISPMSSCATSSTAGYVLAQIGESRERFVSSVYFGQDAKDVLSELCDVYDQCHEPNWDGYGAPPISQDTYREAYRFLESLPWGTTKPTVGAESDGHLTLEWHRSSRRTLSVSISADGDLHYAALLGISKAYGAEPFFGETPQSILDLINRVCAA